MLIDLKIFGRLSLLRWAIVAIVIGLPFQNCSSYEGANSPLFNDSSNAQDLTGLKTCLGTVCPTSTDEVRISINNISPVRVAASDASIDLAGDCNPGGFDFDTTQFFYKIETAARTAVKSKTLANALHCDHMGRWRVSVPTTGLTPQTTDYYIAIEMSVYVNGVEQAVGAKTNIQEILTGHF